MEGNRVFNLGMCFVLVSKERGSLKRGTAEVGVRGHQPQSLMQVFLCLSMCGSGMKAPHRQPPLSSRTLLHKLVSRNAGSQAGLREASSSLYTDEVIRMPALSWSLAHSQLFVVLFFFPHLKKV